jgi:hypothetical protein
VAATRNTASGALRLFIDGQADGPAVSGATGEVGYRNGRATAHPNSDPFLVLGAEKHDVGLAFHGWIDELRISHVVRYSGAFTPPGAPFNTDANTAALYHFDEDNAGHGRRLGFASGGQQRRTPGGSSAQSAVVTGTPFASGTVDRAAVLGSVGRPTSITSCGDNRLFITEQVAPFVSGRHPDPPPRRLPNPLSGRRPDLLSVAFHPHYAQNGSFLLHRPVRRTIARYHVSGDPSVADPNSGVTLISIPHGLNHNGGQLQFGPDGYLYAGSATAAVAATTQRGGCSAACRYDARQMLRIDSTRT